MQKCTVGLLGAATGKRAFAQRHTFRGQCHAACSLHLGCFSALCNQACLQGCGWCGVRMQCVLACTLCKDMSEL